MHDRRYRGVFFDARTIDNETLDASQTCETQFRVLCVE
jgi:hypothetical protein